MKYEIGLTENQATRVNDILLGLSEAWGYGQGKLKLKPCEVRNVEDTNEYKIGYKQGKLDTDADSYAEGYEKGLKIGATGEYDKGYNSAINDYNAMYEWLHDCFVDFEKFLLEKGFYTDEKFSDGFVVGQLMYDLICDHDIAEVIAEFKKWQEEKKKAEEIKVGDEVKDLATDNMGVVMFIGRLIVYITNDGVYTNTLGSLEKTGRHFDEIEQLLDKLRGEE